MTSRFEMTTKRTGAWIAACAALVGLGAASGCNGGSSSGNAIESQGFVVDAAAFQGGPLLALVAGQAALSQTSSYTLPVGDLLCTGAVVTIGGGSNATSGTITVAFPGTGCSTNFGAVYGGSYTATYAASGGTVTVTSTFTNLEVQSTNDEPFLLSGSLTLTLTVNGQSASGSLGGTLSLTQGSITRDVEVDLTTILFDNTQLQVTIDAGTATIDDPVLGSWDVTFDAVTCSLDAANPCVVAGTITGEKLGIQVALEFDTTGCNEGDVVVEGIVVGTFSW